MWGGGEGGVGVGPEYLEVAGQVCGAVCVVVGEGEGLGGLRSVGECLTQGCGKVWERPTRLERFLARTSPYPPAEEPICRIMLSFHC